MSDEHILNIAAYRFVPLTDTAELASRLRHSANAGGLKGTVLLAPEGINLFLAGAEPSLRAWLVTLKADPRFAGLPVKESWSRAVPFRKLLVKVKREIIRMNDEGIVPNTQVTGGQRAPAVDAATLKRWLDMGHDDTGRPVVMLDTRNGFEVDAGAFDGALDWRLHKFSDFPAALAAHRGELAGKTVVSYCTGGIRCEKAALLMQREGLSNVWQLEGGILKYFEEVGTASDTPPAKAPHYHGTCFVFDERETLAADLNPRPLTLTTADPKTP